MQGYPFVIGAQFFFFSLGGELWRSAARIKQSQVAPYCTERRSSHEQLKRFVRSFSKCGEMLRVTRGPPPPGGYVLSSSCDNMRCFHFSDGTRTYENSERVICRLAHGVPFASEAAYRVAPSGSVGIPDPRATLPQTGNG